ncbi:MAG: hypothetical protein WCP45_07975 [Verrucomicrobiota bacterium]
MTRHFTATPRRFLAGFTAVLLLVPLAALHAAADAARLASPGNTTYYVDPIKDDDMNSGTTGSKPWAMSHGILTLPSATAPWTPPPAGAS